MSGAQLCEDFYQLAAESHQAVAALKINESEISVVSVPAGPILEKYRQMRTEYLLWDSRLQDIAAGARDLSADTLIIGLAQEAARAAVISGHLALMGVLPADLTRLLASSWFYSYLGAVTVRQGVGTCEHILRDKTYLHSLDMLPSFDAFPDRDKCILSLCKAGYLECLGGQRWWEAERVYGFGGSGALVQAATAAEYMLRIPSMVWKAPNDARLSRSERALPRPLGDAVTVLQALTQLEHDVKGITLDIEEEIERRNNWLAGESTE